MYLKGRYYKLVSLLQLIVDQLDFEKSKLFFTHFISNKLKLKQHVETVQ